MDALEGDRAGSIDIVGNIVLEQADVVDVEDRSAPFVQLNRIRLTHWKCG